MKIRIEQDATPESPQEWHNLGTMVCWHGRYQLGDEQPSESPQEWLLHLAEEFEPGIEERVERFAERLWDRLAHLTVLEDRLEAHAKDVAGYRDRVVGQVLDRHVIMLPLFLYDHSGITMRTTPFSCPWDSGQVGHIWVSRKTVRETQGWKKISPQRADDVRNWLRAEVEVYDQYLRGEVYGFVITNHDDELIDSCWGFYGDDPFTNGMSDNINHDLHHLLKEAQP